MTRATLWSLILTLLLSACGVPAAPAQGASSATTASSSSPTNTPAPPSAVHPDAPTATPTVGVRKLTVVSQPSSGSSSTIHIQQVTPTPTPEPSPTATPTVTTTDSLLAEPVIFSGLGFDRPCGHVDIVAYDGHALRATPRLLLDDGNFYERLPEGTQVKLIDCRLWTDLDDLTWAAVQTKAGKLGWILIQPDSVYVTIYPIAKAPPALTGLPAGGSIAYMPPSECQGGPVTNEGVATSIGIDLIPVVGDVKGLAEVGTGCDLVTGEPLGDWRWFGLLGIVGLSEVALLRHADDAADAARLAGNLDTAARNADELALPLAKNVDELSAPLARNADEAADIAGRNVDEAGSAAGRNADEAGSAVGRNADEVGDLAKVAGKADGLVDEGIDAAKLVENSSSSVEEAALLAAKFEQPCSFSADTPVHTGRGPIPISRVKVGDTVLAYHEGLAATGLYTVTNTFTHLDPTVVMLEVGGETIETTPEHPFYVDGHWVAAADLDAGDALASLTKDGNLVEAQRTDQRPQVMYNLTVAEAHTYFIGEDGLLVHNACSRVLRPQLDGSEEFKKIKSYEQMHDVEIPWQAHHIIPGQLEDHDFVRKAIDDGGWKIDGASNGVALPAADDHAKLLGMPSHRGSHGNYTRGVLVELDALQSRALADEAAGNVWTAQRYADELDKLAAKKKLEILRMNPSRLN